jgi:predicted dehydrogenase
MAVKYRAVIVGCGQIGRHHATGYAGAEGIDLIAVAEPNERVREEFQEQFEVPKGYADFREMLEKERPDLVSICTWHLLHAPQTIAAAEYGPKAILCEKPMAVGTAAADRMIEACESRGVRLAIGHQRRFYASWTKARELAAAGAIGTPQMVTARSGEGLLNCGTHVVDAMRYILGDPETSWVMSAVERKSDRYEREVQIEDRCMGLIGFENGTQAFIQSDLTKEWTVENYHVQGTDGVIDVSTRTVKLLNGKSGGWEVMELEDRDPWVEQARALVGWVEGRNGHRGEARQARRTVEILMAIYQSARDHEVVRMPLKETGYPMDLMIAEGKLPVQEPGKYDIRVFLTFDPEERKRYNDLRRQGMYHREILRTMGK